MEKLWLYTEDFVQVIDLATFHKRDLQIGQTLSDTLTVPVQMEEKIHLKWETAQKKWVGQNGDQRFDLPERKAVTFPSSDKPRLTLILEGLSIPDRPQGFYIGQKKQITIGGETADFSFSEANTPPGFLLTREGGNWYLLAEEGNQVYLNGGRIRSRTQVALGDVLSWALSEWTLQSEDLLIVRTTSAFHTALFPAKNPRTILADRYPDYQRMPRLIYERPREKVKFSWPTNPDKGGNRNLWVTLLPPLLMLIVMGIVLIVQPSGIYMLLSIVMFLTTIVTSTFQYFHESRQLKERLKERQTNYTHYLAEKREELNTLYERQRFVLRYQFPDSSALKELAEGLSPRIWERSREEEDFLDIRLGTTTLPADYEIEASEEEVSNRSFDALYVEAKAIVDHYRQVRDVPLTIALTDGPLGLTGKHSIIRTAVQQIILQLAFFHSYHDLRIVLLFDQEEYDQWAWLKWLPHLNSLSTQGRNMVYNEQTRDQLLPSLYEQLKIREHTEHKEKKLFLPHLLFIVASDQLIHEHEIAEFLNKDYTEIGVSSIFLANTKDNLNENVQTVVRYVNANAGDVLILKQVANGQRFQIDPFVNAGNEWFARRLASLKHRSSFSNSIPENVTFMEMMHAEDADELDIERRWSEHDPIQSLAVPIGLRSRNDVLELNLHEKAHGPHGLLAGTTGSGKSELLQSYILSLAVNFHPHDVAFLLIDFKGGGMAQLFEKLPHLLGTMTNINDEKNFSDRALAAVKSESRRRQLLFSKYGINHIDDYQLLHRQGKVSEPMPHLFIISDEFAELKKEEPDFIRELVTTARIGRSLGIHLILATQKPAGVVDDQIRSNSRFKIALRVQDSADSNDILGNGDAASLKQVGRGYLQVGNNEIYELFQSAWSGAPYEKTIYTSEDDVYAVEDTGLYPISEAHAKKKVQAKKISELEQIVQTIADICQRNGVERLPSPWVAPLPIHQVRPVAKEREKDAFLLGLADHPEKQMQTPVYLSLKKSKNIAIFGASGFGKTTTLSSYLLEAAASYSADEVQFYLFDFGSGGLLSLRRLHHTGDYFRIDEKEKISKFSKWLNLEIQRRKDLFRRSGVPNIELYNEQESEKLPYLKIAVDNFEALREEQADALEEAFVRWAREGGSLGLQFILTVSRANGIRPNLLTSLPIRLSHYMVDQTEFYSIFSGSVKKTVEAIPGRALIKTEDLESIQIYLPFEAKTAGEQLTKWLEAVDACNADHPVSSTLYHIPMLPEQLDAAEFLENEALLADTLYLGLDEESVEPIGIECRQLGSFIIIGDPKKGKTNAVRFIIDQLQRFNHASLAISDSEELVFAKDAEKNNWTYLDDGTAIELYADQIEAVFSAREREIKEKMLDDDLPRAELAAAYPAYYLLIDSLDAFIRKAGTMQNRIIQLMKRYSSIGFHVIAAGNALEWKGYDPLITELKTVKDGLLLIKKTDQSVFTLPFVSKERELAIGFGYLLHQGQDRRLMIPRAKRVLIKTG
ncbi:MAG: type VII secretion protein EssC [Sporolactobacillus sp.]